MIHKHGCHYVCSMCGFKENIHYYGQCNCEEFSFVKPYLAEVPGPIDLDLIKNKLESLLAIKHKTKDEYLHFQKSDIPHLSILKNIRNLSFPNVTLHSIQFNVSFSKTKVYFNQGHEKQLSTETDMKLLINRVSKESYILIIEARQEL
jgi:hypothetical protein